MADPFLEALIYGVRDVYNGVTLLVRKSQLVFRNGLTATVSGDQIIVDASGGGAAPASVAISAMDIDWSLGNIYTKTLASGANTFTFSNDVDGLMITVRVTSNGGGSTLTWPTVLWPGGAAPTQTSTGVDVYTFFKDGSDIYGVASQAFA